MRRPPTWASVSRAKAVAANAQRAARPTRAGWSVLRRMSGSIILAIMGPRQRRALIPIKAKLGDHGEAGLMNAFLEAVGATPLSQLLQNVRWLIPLIQSTHILALSLVFVSAAVVDLRLLGVAGRGQALSSLTHRFLPWVGWGVL